MIKFLPEKRKGQNIIHVVASFLFLYILWTIETVLPSWFPDFSLIFIIIAALSFPPAVASFLGFFLGFLSDNLSPNLLGRYTTFYTLLSFLLSYFKNYIIFSYPYLFLLVSVSIFLKGLIGGFHLLKFLLTLLFLIPFIKILRKWGKDFILIR
ncbi:MAG: rod shape-determining protein MreD [candidate division WOR-3 bacterium]